jgi:hypothetical protein
LGVVGIHADFCKNGVLCVGMIING